MENGTIDCPVKSAKAGVSVKVNAKPNQGYGLSKGVFYAVVKANGEYASIQSATNTSTYPDDRANDTQEFSFTMPAGNVEVWASFVPLRTLVIHQTDNGKLKPLYGVENKTIKDSNVVRNVPLKPIKLRVLPDTAQGYVFLDVAIKNVDPRYCQKTDTLITVNMPNDADTIHVTPVFSKPHYKVIISGNQQQGEVTLSNPTPKAREEVDVTMLCKKDYIPANVTITGCKSWWRVGTPERQGDGRWKVVYRFKVDLQDVTVKVNYEQVHTITVNDTKNTGRVKTYIPEMIPGFPGVARKGQQIPVVFTMPSSFSAQYSTSNIQHSTFVYHNVLQNSFADEGMSGWKESQAYVNVGLPMTVAVDSTGNRYWRTSVQNSMSQAVSLPSQNIPENVIKNGKLSIAAIASINPCRARSANVSIMATGPENEVSQLLVGDLSDQEEGWQTVFNTGEVSSKTDTLKLVVTSLADNLEKKRSYEGPMFDDLCLLLPKQENTINNEDVIIFTMDEKDAVINYTPLGKQSKVSVKRNEHATVTLLNTNTGEEGETILAMENDVIVVKGQSNEGYAVYQMSLQTGDNGSKVDLTLDSLNMDAGKVFYHFIKRGKTNDSIIPDVKPLEVYPKSNYGGTLTVSNVNAKKGETVVFTITPNPGCKLRKISTTPAGVVEIKEESVDPTTGGGNYSFVMTTAHITLTTEFTVPISTAEQLGEIHNQYGAFYLEGDIDLGDDWNTEITVYGDFDGRGHRITYSGSYSLFETVGSRGSVSHLYVNAHVNGEEFDMGGIAKYNQGVIDDCEVSGILISTEEDSYVGGIAGKNEEGTITHCHVICDTIRGGTAFGIASQESGATISANVFNGQFGNDGSQAYMICNDEPNSTVEGNYYIASQGNREAGIVSGVTAGNSEDLVNLANSVDDRCPVFAASIKNKYTDVYKVKLLTSTEVQQVNLSTDTGVAGTVVYASVRVTGNNHLDGIVVSAIDGSDAQSCPFTDNTENGYSFSFTMPAHDVQIAFTTKPGRLIYTAKNFCDIDNENGTFYLVRNIELNNWGDVIDLDGKFYGSGHTIKYNASSSCNGLFREIKPGALLQGLRVVGYVETEKNCGGIALTNNGTIRDCHFTGRITNKSVELTKKKKPTKCAAIVCNMASGGSVIDHCSATGELINSNNQKYINEHPLCAQSGVNITNSHWVIPTETGNYQELLSQAHAALTDFPVYAEGILDKINPRVIVGRDTMRVENSKTLDKLTITDGEPFTCTNDIKVNQIVYRRKATKELEQWVLPFAFDRIAGAGTFEYHETMKEKDMPAIEKGETLTLSNAPSALHYEANEPWLVKLDGDEYTLSSASGPITVKATDYNHIKQYASLMDEGHFYATYDSITTQTAKDNLIYVWNGTKQEFVLSGESAADDDILPFRFYLQFYNKQDKKFEKYTQTNWAKKEAATGNRASSRPRRLASAMADGWQPIFLDPRQPQSVTARMLDYYEVACLTDINAEVLDEDDEQPLTVVSLVYQKVDSRTELPKALPLLVRAKRADAEPLVDEKTGAELEELLLKYLEDEDMEDGASGSLDFYMPHYWCASSGKRLDIWALPAPEKYADLAEYGAMMFEDNYYDQSFLYAGSNDSRTTAPMSYCITLYNDNTYELLPLMGDRVSVEFIPSAGEATGISSNLKHQTSNLNTYNLSGQRVNASYKGIVLQNGRKVYKK